MSENNNKSKNNFTSCCTNIKENTTAVSKIAKWGPQYFVERRGKNGREFFENEFNISFKIVK